MAIQRTDRLNSLLKEEIAKVIQKDMHNPDLPPFVSVTRVDITKDLRHAKVYVSVIGGQEEKEKAIQALTSAAGFIAVTASKRVVMRFFPELIFRIDESVEKHLRIEELLSEINAEKKLRPSSEVEGDVNIEDNINIADDINIEDDIKSE